MENKTSPTVQENAAIVFDIKEFFMSKSNFQRHSRVSTINFSSDLDVTSKISKSKKLISVFIEIRLHAKDKDNKDVFSLTSNFMGEFSYQGTVANEQAQIEGFSKGNGPAILYPLIRASVASQSVAAELPPIRLPIINFFNFPVTVEYVD